jgi:hypothetical protein
MTKVIAVAPREVLLSRDTLFNLSDALGRLSLSRRQVTEWGTQTLYDWIEWGGVILSGEGEEIEIYPGIFDDAHGEDGSGVWVSEQRRRGYPERGPRRNLLLRLQLYDAIFRIQGNALGADARRQELEVASRLLRSFTPIWRARYLHERRRLQQRYQAERKIHYGAALRRLRIRFGLEMAEWCKQKEN